MRKICAAYWVLLTCLLLARDPLGLFDGGRRFDRAYDYIEPVAHLASFTLLALLVLCTRWPLRRRWLMAIVAGYGVATELVQSQVPGRHMQLVDLVQDFGGILLGSLIYWICLRVTRQPAATEPLTPDAAWEIPRRREPAIVESAGELG
jgi:VanZ family protein